MNPNKQVILTLHGGDNQLTHSENASMNRLKTDVKCYNEYLRLFGI